MAIGPKDTAVFSEECLWALLRLGYRERLVHVKHRAVLHQLQEEASNPALESFVLEQLILTPTILANFDRGSLAEDLLEGPLLDSFTIKPTKAAPPNFQLDAIPVEAIAGLLVAQGYDVPAGEFIPRLLNAAKVLNDENDLRQAGYELPGFADFVRRIVVGCDEFSASEWAEYDEREQVKEAAQPVLSAISDFEELATTAAKENAVLVIPRTDLNQATIVNDDFDVAGGTPDQQYQQLFRFAATEMGRLTAPPSLSATMKLAADPATGALRDRCRAWIGAINEGEISELQTIKAEIHKAMASLERSGTVSKRGTLVTYASLPISIAALLTGPTATAALGVVGLAATSICVAVTSYENWREHQLRWAMFRSVG